MTAEIFSIELIVTQRSSKAPLWEAVKAAEIVLLANGLNDEHGEWKMTNAVSPSGDEWYLTFKFYTFT